MIHVMDDGMSLRISECLPRDVGRGIARMDPKDIEALGASVGDVVEITGKRTTVAKVMPAFIEARDKSLVQIDGITRENTQAGIDEKVAVRKTVAKSAVKIEVAPLTLMRMAQKERDNQYIGKLLQGLPVVQEDRVRATLFGSHYQEFTIIRTIPDGPVIIQPDTVLSLIHEKQSPDRKKHKISYEDIGGLRKEIQKIREMIELPIKYPQLFEQLGIEPPKGVLLHGPPGTGKTMIARAVANETDAYFIAVSGPEVIHKFYGESEAKLRNLFDQARKNAPSIIFLDEIDALAPKREAVVGEVEKRVVAQLLALMDGLESRGQVIVIGATNMPNALDSALRRPGRFDRELIIGVPDKYGRNEILQIHTRGMPLSDEVDLDVLAHTTHGFVGADLEALCREAAMICLRKILPQIDFDLDTIPYEILLALQVTMDDFMEALKAVEPSIIREVFTEIPDVRWQDIGGLAEAKRELIEAVEWPLKHPELFRHLRSPMINGILLYGPPGTGKTLLARAVATESGVNFISVKGPALLSKWVGESEKGIREIFKKAKHAAPCVIFFDEIDSLAPTRSSFGSESHVTERVVSQLLTEMDGIEKSLGIVVLGATNRLDIIDPSLLRPGRFDLLVEIPPPEKEARIEILKVHMQGRPVADDADVESLADMTEGWVGADIKFLCVRASLAAIRVFLQRGLNKNNLAELQITMEHFQEALMDIKKIGNPGDHSNRIDNHALGVTDQSLTFSPRFGMIFL